MMNQTVRSVCCACSRVCRCMQGSPASPNGYPVICFAPLCRDKSTVQYVGVVIRGVYTASRACFSIHVSLT